MWANKYVGIEFVEGSRDISNGGLDCYGLVRYILTNETNISLPKLDNIAYSTRTKNRHEIIKFIRAFDATSLNWSLIDKNEVVQKFDVLLFNNCGIMHMALALNRYEFIHIEDGCNACIERLDSIRWSGRIKGIYRHNVPLFQSTV